MCFFALNDNFTLCTIDYFFALLNFVSINNYYYKMGRTKGTAKTGGRKKGRRPFFCPNTSIVIELL